MSPSGPESSPRGADASEVTCIQDPSVGSEPVAEPNKIEDQSESSFNDSLTTTTSHHPEASSALDTYASAALDQGDDTNDADRASTMTDKPAATAQDDSSFNRPEAEPDTLLPTSIPTAPEASESPEPSPASPLAASTANEVGDEASGMRTSAELEQGAGSGSGNAEAESKSQADADPEAEAVSSKAAARDAPATSHEATMSASKNSAKAAAKPSALTIKATSASPSSSSPMQTEYPNSQLLAPEHPSYVDPTPPTPMASRPPSRALSSTPRSDDASPTASGPESDDKPYTSEDDQEGSRSEIQSIMEQFSENGGGPDANEVMSPRLEIASPMLGTSLQHPPRKSSLEPLSPTLAGQAQGLNALHISTPNDDDQGPPVPPKDGSMGTPPRSKDARPPANVTSPTSPTLPMHRPPPPEPEPEPALPFDFHRFLEQLRNKKADPVARYLKSFLFEFGKRQWMVHEQVKIISDFLAFIANKMMQCEVWRDVSDAEFDNAREGMEKLVMNRLYTQTFSPAIPPPKPIPGAKPKRRGGDPPLGPGRRGQHQEDVERDDIVTQKINIYGWVREEHLDIPPVGDSGRRFLKLAQQGESPMSYFYFFHDS